MTAQSLCEASELLVELESSGIQLEADGDRLTFRPREKVTVELTRCMKAQKGELLSLLSARKTASALSELVTTWPEDWQDQWKERAAILEYDGGMPRILAEEWAFHFFLSVILGEHDVHYVPGSIPTANLLGIELITLENYSSIKYNVLRELHT